MAGLIPFNRKNSNQLSAGFPNFYNMLDDFFNDSWMQGRSLMCDTFKIDVKETDKEYLIEADLPGVKKEEVNLSFNDGRLGIEVKKEENVEEESKNYIHRERRCSSMSRSILLADAKGDDVKAKLENGVLMIAVQKQEKPSNSFKIDIE